MADTNKTYLAVSEETTWGETPSSPTMDKLRYTSESLTEDLTVGGSDEIRDDRLTGGVYRSELSVVGDVNGEYTDATWKKLMRGALMRSAWQADAVNVSGTTISFDNAGSTIDDSGSGLAGFTPGLLHVYGSGASNDGVYRITAVTAGSLTVEPAPSTEAAGATITLRQTAADIGTDLVSFLFERGITDTDDYFQYTGCAVDSITLSASRGNPLTIALSLIGKEELDPVGATVSGTLNSANANTIYNPVDHIGGFLEAGVRLTGARIREIEVTLRNNLRTKGELGSAAPFDLGLGEAVVEGSLVAYFVNTNLYQKFKDFTDTDLAFYALQGAASATQTGFGWDVANLNFTDGQILSTGKNDDVMAELSFQAKVNSNSRQFGLAIFE